MPTKVIMTLMMSQMRLKRKGLTTNSLKSEELKLDEETKKF